MTTTFRVAAIVTAITLGSFAEGRQTNTPRPRYDVGARKWGYAVPGAEPDIPPRYDSAAPFAPKEGLAAVEVDGRFFYITRSGAKAFEQTFEFAGEFSGGVAAVARDGKFALIDAAGRAVTAFQFDSLGTLSDGLVRARVGDRVGFIDAAGEWKVAAVYEAAGEFSQARAWVKKGGKVGFIDPAGAAVVEPRFEEADGFTSGMAAVKEGGKFGYVSPGGKLVIPPMYDKVTPFQQHGPERPAADVYTKRGKGQIDTTGKSLPKTYPAPLPPDPADADMYYTITTAPHVARVYLVPMYKIPPKFLTEPQPPRAEWEGWMTLTYGGHDSPYTRRHDGLHIMYVVICEFSQLPGKPIKPRKFHPVINKSPFQVQP